MGVVFGQDRESLPTESTQSKDKCEGEDEVCYLFSQFNWNKKLYIHVAVKKQPSDMCVYEKMMMRIGFTIFIIGNSSHGLFSPNISYIRLVFHT